MKQVALALAALATATMTIPTVASAQEAQILNVQYMNDGPPPPRGWDHRGPDYRRGPPPADRGDWGRPSRRDILGPRQISRNLQRRGYAVGDIRLERDTYFVRATRPNGRRAIVMVDAYTGRIVGERPVGRPRF